MKFVAIGLAAAMVLAVGAAGQARADDYVALCKANEKDNANADKMCSCASDKLKPDDRAAAITALKTLNDAMLNGKTPDSSNPDVEKGMAAQMAAESQCM